MSKVKTRIKRFGNSLYILIPEAIVDHMDFIENQSVKVPFNGIEKSTGLDEEYELEGDKKAKYTIKDYSGDLERKRVVEVLESDDESIRRNFKSAFLSYKGEKFSIKDLFHKVTGVPKDKYVTRQVEKYFHKLGFSTKRF